MPRARRRPLWPKPRSKRRAVRMRLGKWPGGQTRKVWEDPDKDGGLMTYDWAPLRSFKGGEVVT